MAAVDQLYNANQANAQLLSIGPLFFILWAFRTSVKNIFGLISSTNPSYKTLLTTSVIYLQIDRQLQDFSRFLILSPRYLSLDSSGEISRNQAQMYGSLVYKIYKLNDLFDALRRILNSRFWRIDSAFAPNLSEEIQRLQESLSDILYPTLTLKQRMSLLQQINTQYDKLKTYLKE